MNEDITFPCGCTNKTSEFLWDDLSIHSYGRGLTHEAFKCGCERVWCIDFQHSNLMGNWIDVFEQVNGEWIGNPKYKDEEIIWDSGIRIGPPPEGFTPFTPYEDKER